MKPHQNGVDGRETRVKTKMAQLKIMSYDENT